MFVVLDSFDGIVAKVGEGPQTFLKACDDCTLLCEHVRVTRSGALESGESLYRYVVADEHRNRCAALVDDLVDYR